MSYSDKLKHPKWQKKRLEILQRENFKCQCCGHDDRTLHIHHLIYSEGEPWDAPNDTLECLCEICHDFRENWNYVWDGRSTISTGHCLNFFNFFKLAFSSNDVPGISAVKTLSSLIKAISDHKDTLEKATLKEASSDPVTQGG
jgi:hypothetical protein